MSKLGKAALVIAILASIGSLVLGFLIATEKTKLNTQLADADTALKKSTAITYTGNYQLSTNEPKDSIDKINKAYATSQSDLSSTKNQLAEKETALTAATVKVNQLTESENLAKADLEKAKGELDTAKAAAAQAAADLDKLKQALQGNDPAQLIADLAKTKDDLKIAQDQQKTSEFENKALVKEVQRLQDLEDRRVARTAPQNLTAKVVAINKPWNFVVLDAGTDKKLVEGVELMVYRGNQFIGKVRTVNVDNKTAVADILQDWNKGQIQIGDQILF